MDETFSVNFSGVTLDARDPKRLMDFYQAFLGWSRVVDSPEFVALLSPTGLMLGAQPVPSYKKPVWPPEEGAPDTVAHCDFKVSDREAAVARAVQLGAVQAAAQFIDGVTVMIDPEGHPFCLSQAQG